MLRQRFVLGGWILLILSGCGGSGYPSAAVQGKVTLNGQDVASGYVSFSPASAGQGPVVGAAIEGGRYRCPKVPLGKQTVTFQLQGPPTTIHDAVTGEDHVTPSSVRLAPEFAAGVAFEIVAGTNERNFDLKTVE